MAPKTDLATSKAHAAAQQVFSLPELLEPILSHLPWSNLFVLRRVNTTFASTISESRTLQERRDLHNIACWPGEAPPPSAVGPWCWEPAFDISPILPELLFSSPTCFDPRAFETRRTRTGITALLHHRVRPHHSAGAGAEVLGVPRPHNRSDPSQAPSSITINPDGSWRRLRISILPVRRMTMHIAVSLPGGISREGVDGTSPPLGSLEPAQDAVPTVTYWEKIDMRTNEANFGDLVEILHELTGRKSEAHAKIWGNLSGREWIGPEAEGFVPMATMDGRLRDGGGIVIERRRRKG